MDNTAAEFNLIHQVPDIDCHHYGTTEVPSSPQDLDTNYNPVLGFYYFLRMGIDTTVQTQQRFMGDLRSIPDDKIQSLKEISFTLCELEKGYCQGVQIQPEDLRQRLEVLRDPKLAKLNKDLVSHILTGVAGKLQHAIVFSEIPYENIESPIMTIYDWVATLVRFHLSSEDRTEELIIQGKIPLLDPELTSGLE